MTESEPEETVLICQRVSDYEPAMASHVDTCALCSRAVWRAQGGPQTDHIYCLPCARIELQKNPRAKIGMLTAEQLKEIRRRQMEQEQ